MSNNESDSKHLFFWICVLIAGGLIFVGWIFSVKYNFAAINSDAAKRIDKSTDQAVNAVQDMFQGFDATLKKGEAGLNNAGSAGLEANLQAAQTQLNSASDKAVQEKLPVPEKK